MKTTIGIVLIIVGILVGLYAGMWWAFIGGIIQIVEAIRADMLIPFDIAFGIARVCFSGFISWMCAIIFIIPGKLLLD